MPLARILWFWVPWTGPRTCSWKGLPITRTERECLWWLSCRNHIPFNSKHFSKMFLVAEWVGIHLWAWFRMVHGGESIGDYSTNISTWKLWPNTSLSKDERPKHFCVDSLLHPITSSITFDSKHPYLICGFSRTLINRFGNKHICRQYYENCIWNRC